MDFFHDLFLITFAVILLSIIITKLITLSDCSGDVSRGEEVCAGKDGNLEKKMKVEGSKSVKKLTSVKKRVRKASREPVLFSEFKGEVEPAVAVHHSFDDRKEEFIATEASDACSAAQLLSAGKVGVDCPVECEGLVSKSCGTLNERVVDEDMGCEEVVTPIEGFDQITDSGTDLEKCNFNYIEHVGSVIHGDHELVHDVVVEELERYVFNYTEEVGSVVNGDHELVNTLYPNTYEETEKTVPEIDYSIKEDDEVREELESCDSNHNKVVGNVDHSDQELLSVVLPSERSKQDKGLEMTDPNIDGGIVVGENEEIKSSESKEDVVNRDREGRMRIVGLDDQELTNADLASNTRGVNEGFSEQDDGEERSFSKNDDTIDVDLSGGENSVGIDLQRTLEPAETETKDGTQDVHVHQGDALTGEIRSLVSKDVVNRDEGGIGDEAKGKVEISDWEEIERNELEKDFAKALNYFECSNKEGQLSMLGSDVMMQFYGLQKVSMEGPCHEPPPMALKLSARAKWNAWQKLGSMVPEEAMEEYISLVSEKVPGWTGNHSYVEGEVSSGAHNCSDVDSSTALTDERKPGEEGVARTAVNSSLVNKDE